MIKRNALSNFIGRLWGIVSLFLFVPFYIHYLGDDGFGYVGFYNTLIALLAFADLGFSAATTREFARFSNGTVNHENNRADLLRTYELIYSFLCVVVGVAIYSSASWVAHDWLIQIQNGIDTTLLVFLMGIGIVFQLPTNLYIGALMGGERQVLANGLQIAWGFLRSAAVLPILHYTDNKLYVFFMWQIFCNVIFLVILYSLTWRTIHFTKRGFNFNLLVDTYKYAFGMAFIGILSAIATQTDKLIISKKFAIDVVGQYSIAATLSLIPLILITTLAKAVFPKMTRIKEKGNADELNHYYSQLSKIACIVVMPLAMVLATYAYELIVIWTNSPNIAMKMQDVVYFLMLAQAIQALTVLPFHLTLSFAYIKINLIFCVIMIILMPILYFGWLYIYQVNGIALSVLATVILVFVPYMYLVHQRLAAGIILLWFKDNMTSIVVSVVVISIMKSNFYVSSGNITCIVLQAFWMWLVGVILVSYLVGVRTKIQLVSILKI